MAKSADPKPPVSLIGDAGPDVIEGMGIHHRLLAVMHEVDYVQKTLNVAGQYRAVSHDEVVGKVRPFLLKWGVVMTCSVDSACDERMEITRGKGNNTYQAIQFRTQVRLRVDFTCHDAKDPANTPSERHTVFIEAVGEDPGDKGFGKAISYAKKYALLTTLMLETGDDADVDLSVEKQPFQAQQKPTRQEKAQPKQQAKSTESDAEYKAKKAAEDEVKNLYAATMKFSKELAKQLWKQAPRIAVEAVPYWRKVDLLMEELVHRYGTDVEANLNNALDAWNEGGGDLLDDYLRPLAGVDDVESLYKGSAYFNPDAANAAVPDVGDDTPPF